MSLTYEEALDAQSLRRAGMTIAGIIVALEHYHGQQRTFYQVEWSLQKAKVKRGNYPKNASRCCWATEERVA